MKKIRFIFLFLLMTATGFAQFTEDFSTLTNPGTALGPNSVSLSSGTWTTYNLTGSSTQAWRDAPSASPGSPSVCAFVSFNTSSPGQDWLITPAINLSGISNPQMKFYSRLTTAGSSTVFKLMKSTTPPTTTGSLASFTEVESWNQTDFNSSYKLVTVDLPTSGTYYFAFVSNQPVTRCH